MVNTIVLMEVGDFIEIYGVETDKVTKGKISEIVNITGWTVGNKKGNLPEYNVESVKMAVFLTILLINGKISY